MWIFDCKNQEKNMNQSVFWGVKSSELSSCMTILNMFSKVYNVLFMCSFVAIYFVHAFDCVEFSILQVPVSEIPTLDFDGCEV